MFWSPVFLAAIPENERKWLFGNEQHPKPCTINLIKPTAVGGYFVPTDHILCMTYRVNDELSLVGYTDKATGIVSPEVKKTKSDSYNHVKSRVVTNRLNKIMRVKRKRQDSCSFFVYFLLLLCIFCCLFFYILWFLFISTLWHTFSLLSATRIPHTHFPSLFHPVRWSDLMHCCRSNWPGLCLFC